MANDIAVLERQLMPLSAEFAQVLPANIPPERLIRTVLISCERNPRLLEPQLRASLLQSAMTASVLGLEVDGVTGQGFIIPFGGKSPRAQFIPGYKGYNTMAARAGYTINGGVVREGDEFDFQEGTGGFVRHKRKLGAEARRKIIAAWATAEAQGRPPIIAVLSIDELLATKAKSAGAKKSDSPWNDPAIGFAAMCEKTAKRRLARSMPLNTYQLAAAMESQHDQGRTCHLTKDAGIIIDGDAEVAPEAPPPTAYDLLEPDLFPVNWNGTIKQFASIEQWLSAMKAGIDKLDRNHAALTVFLEANKGAINQVRGKNQDAAEWVLDAFVTAIDIARAQ